MDIIVCVKQVIDTAARIDVREGKAEAPGSPRVMNPYDEFAVEEALLIREKFPAAKITLISLGPDGCREILKTGLAMGADQAVHLQLPLPPMGGPLPAEPDSLAVARALAQALRGRPYDLILCGRQAIDDDMAAVGPALAVLLEMPFVTVATKLVLSPDGRSAAVTRQIEGGSETLTAPLPLLVTCQKGLNVPRLPSLKGIMAAKKKTVEILPAEMPAAPGAARSSLSLPPPRKKGRMFEGEPRERAAQLARLLHEEEKIV